MHHELHIQESNRAGMDSDRQNRVKGAWRDWNESGHMFLREFFADLEMCQISKNVKITSMHRSSWQSSVKKKGSIMQLLRA